MLNKFLGFNISHTWKFKVCIKFNLQDLIDKARTLLVGNRTQLQRLQASTGIPATTDDDPAYVSFNQVCILIKLIYLD